MVLRMLSFRFTISSNCLESLVICSITTSSKFPVWSFLYLEIKGMVQSSANNFKVALILFGEAFVW